jgi:hypothetical protein
MSVGTFTQPSFTTMGGTAYKTAIDNSIAALARLANAFSPHERTTPNMTIQVSAGALFSGNTLTEVPAHNTPTITAPAASPRIDRVVIDAATGVVSVVPGTEGSPSPPAIPAGKLPIAQIALSVGQVAITNANITDERVGITAAGGGGINRVAKSGAYTVVSGNKGQEIACTASLTLTFSACASLLADFYCWVKVVGTGKITLTANGSEKFYIPGGDPAGVNSFTISPVDPAATLYPCDGLLVQTNGTDLHVLGLSLAPARTRPAPAPQIVRHSSSVGIVKVIASADAPVGVSMVGFPNLQAPGQFIDGGLTDSRYRQVTADVSCDMTQAAARWGNYKDNQWYALYALAAASATTFTLKAMPLMRFASQAGQVITLRKNDGTGNIGYGFAANELAGGKIYILSGSDAGQVRSITANNTDNGSAGTITYSGTALANISGNDWFVLLPPGTNFRWLRNFFHQTTGGNPDIPNFIQMGDWVKWAAPQTWDYRYIDPMSAMQLESSATLYLNQVTTPFEGASISGYAYAPGLR